MKVQGLPNPPAALSVQFIVTDGQASPLSSLPQHHMSKLNREDSSLDISLSENYEDFEQATSSSSLLQKQKSELKGEDNSLDVSLIENYEVLVSWPIILSTAQ